MLENFITTTVVYNGHRVAVPDRPSIERVLSEFEVQLSPHQIQQVQAYFSALVYWNQRLSLTSVTDPAEILERHFGESMFSERFVEVQNGRLADLGSGAGFPGLALKIAIPSLQVLLIEQNTKKSTFLNEVIRSLKLTGITVQKADFLLIPATTGPFDYITVRAVGDHRSILRWASGRLSDRGKMLLWLGKEDSTKISKLGGWSWDPPLPIPHSKSRLILGGSPVIA